MHWMPPMPKASRNVHHALSVRRDVLVTIRPISSAHTGLLDWSLPVPVMRIMRRQP